MVVAVRTPPYASWKDPAECIMSILNIGLQAVGLMHSEIPHSDNNDIESGLKKRKSMKDICAYAEKDGDVGSEVIESVKGVKDLLRSVFSKLSLKGKPFEIFEAASDIEIDDLFSEMIEVDSTLGKDDISAQKVKNKDKLLNFLETHCLRRDYMFAVKKLRFGGV